MDASKLFEKIKSKLGKRDPDHSKLIISYMIAGHILNKELLGPAGKMIDKASLSSVIYSSSEMMEALLPEAEKRAKLLGINFNDKAAFGFMLNLVDTMMSKKEEGKTND